MPIGVCGAQKSEIGRLERVVVNAEMQKPGFNATLLIGRTFNAKKEIYTSMASDPRGVFIPYVFDSTSSRICTIVLGRKMSDAKQAAVLTEDQKSDSLIVDVLVLPKKKLFVVADPLLTLAPGEQRWKEVTNMFGICEYNTLREIVYEKLVVPEFKFRIGDGSPKIEIVKKFKGRIYRDNNN
jgi:hypothetical protein